MSASSPRPDARKGPGDPILRISGLRVEFQDTDGIRVAVADSTLEVCPGEVLGIVGESGSGKTVTCAAAMGLLNGWPGITAGSVEFDTGDGLVNLLAGLDKTLLREPGKPVRKKERAWKFYVKRHFRPHWGSGMTMIFQNPQSALNPFWKVGQLVGEAVRLRDPGLSKAARRRRGLDWLERVKLNNPDRVWTSYPHELSGGMAQRVMIASALARGARLLFADEPTTGLDTTVKARIVELFSALRREEKLALVVISHDLGVVASLSDRVVVMKDGLIVETRHIRDVTGRAPDLDAYTQELIGAVDVWKETAADDGAGDPSEPPAAAAPSVGSGPAEAAAAESVAGEAQTESGAAAEPTGVVDGEGGDDAGRG